jgi:hypothetical protein
MAQKLNRAPDDPHRVSSNATATIAANAPSLALNTTQ